MAYSDIKDPSAHFQTITYTGDGTEPRNIDVGFQADLIWAKDRSDGYHHRVFDSSRGGAPLYPNQNAAEDNYNDGPEIDFSSPYSNGFKIIDNPDGATNSYGVNMNNNLMVSWNWKANGGTTSSNTDGYLTSTVQANTDAGFSIVTFTTDGSTRTVGHGLGVKPDVILIASRNVAGGFLFITDVIDGSMDYGVLSSSNAFASIGYNAPTSTVFEYNDNNTNTQVAYCFAEKQGFSKFGKYVGNGNANGPFVYTGFKPAFVIVKNITNTGYDWAMSDHKRSSFNEVDKYLWSNLGSAEYDGSGINLDIDYLSNGFKLRTSRSETNLNTSTYIYMAFAENPFVAAGIPTTAR